MAKLSVRLSPGAAGKARKPDDVRKAALEAFQKAGGGFIYAAPFSSNGQNFALSSRMIIEVDWLPGRIPPGALGEPPRRLKPEGAKRPGKHKGWKSGNSFVRKG